MLILTYSYILYTKHQEFAVDKLSFDGEVENLYLDMAGRDLIKESPDQVPN
jgi:hypothetical protein